MKKRLSAVVLMLAFFVTSAFAASQYKQIQVEYGIKLQINGISPALTDANGNAVQPFTYNGTTYVPIRAVANELGAKIDYSNSTNTAIINGSISKIQYLYRLSDLSHRINNSCTWIVADSTDKVEQSLIESRMKEFDALSAEVSAIKNSLSITGYTSDSGIPALVNSISDQFSYYDKALAAFINVQAGDIAQAVVCVEQAEQQAKCWYTIEGDIYNLVYPPVNK